MTWLWKSKTLRELEKLQKEYENMHNSLLILKDALLEKFILSEVRADLKKHDLAASIEEKRHHWHEARQKLLKLKKLGFEEEVRAFVKKEGRTIKLIQD